MSIEIKVPGLPESVSEATIAAWHKKPGEAVKRDENLVDIETDKVVLEVVAPADGHMDKIIKDVGSIVKDKEIIGVFIDSPNAVNSDVKAEVKPKIDNKELKSKTSDDKESDDKELDNVFLSPTSRRAIHESDIDPEKISGTGKHGRITKLDVDEYLTNPDDRMEKRVPMTRLRAKIAERLLDAQHNSAILTTFNEVNMQPIMSLRSKYKDSFEKKHGVRLGFMSFFVTAVVAALKRFPVINASIDGNDMVYHGYFDIGVAVSTPRGLVVPILRNADTLSMAEIERKVVNLGKNAQEGKLSMEDITGGTFTITNGGVFGSLMSTPILNPPQSGILGMHKIEDRPIVENKQIVIKPMMYLALSYDHRIIDGAESVKFLVAVKEMLEEPARLLLSI